MILDVDVQAEIRRAHVLRARYIAAAIRIAMRAARRFTSASGPIAVHGRDGRPDQVIPALAPRTLSRQPVKTSP